jgi:hypothetical protein
MLVAPGHVSTMFIKELHEAIDLLLPVSAYAGYMIVSEYDVIEGLNGHSVSISFNQPVPDVIILQRREACVKTAYRLHISRFR